MTHSIAHTLRLIDDAEISVLEKGITGGFEPPNKKELEQTSQLNSFFKAFFIAVRNLDMDDYGNNIQYIAYIV